MKKGGNTFPLVVGKCFMFPVDRLLTTISFPFVMQVQVDL